MSRKSKPTTERDGRLLAVKMLREMGTYFYREDPDDVVNTLWLWSIEAQYRPKGMQQDNVLLRYLDSIQGNREALAGFCAVVTDHLGQADQGGGINFPESYEALTKREITGKPGPWPSMDDDEVKEKTNVIAFARPGAH